MLNLFIFNHIGNDAAISALLRFRENRSEEDYYEAVRGLIAFSQNRLTDKDIIKEYILRTMLEKESLPDITKLRNFLRHDIKIIYNELLNYDWNSSFAEAGLLPVSDIGTKGVSTGLAGYVISLEAMMDCESNEALGGAILAHAESFGTGEYAAYAALKWSNGELKGIIRPDEISFADIEGVEHQKNILITNTESLVLENGGTDILLKGDACTGKSSCIKACLNLFKNSGLRLIEVAENDICDLPEIYDCIKSDILKYIIFIDGITENENGICRELKSVLGGQTEAKKNNVLIYATASAENLHTAPLFGLNLDF